MFRKLAIFLVLSILNILAFLLAVESDQNIIIFLLLHATSVAVFYVLNTVYIKIDSTDFPLYLIICFPGIGFSLLTIIYFSVVLLPSFTKEIDHITIVDKEDDYITFSFLDSKKVLTHLDSMKYLSQQDKLSFIFDVLDSDLINKAVVLNESLTGENYDLRYYSSIYLSAMSNELEGSVFKLKREYELTKEYEVLKELLEVLKRYIDTGLLESDMLQFYNNLYIKYLEDRIEMDDSNNEFKLELIRSKLMSHQYEDTLELINEMDQNLYEVNMLKFELLYTMKQYKPAKQLANLILKNYENIPISDLGILNYWR